MNKEEPQYTSEQPQKPTQNKREFGLILTIKYKLQSKFKEGFFVRHTAIKSRYVGCIPEYFSKIS